MKVIEQCMSFNVANLRTTKDMLTELLNTEISRLIVGQLCCSYKDVIEIIFCAMGKIVPFEISNMIGHSWIVIDERGNVIYNLVL